VLSIAPKFPVLAPERWESVMRVVRERLLTPVGLRSLAPGDSDYKPKYFGDLRTRDAAYHQGTVWGWLVGPYVDAWLKVYPSDIDGARRAVQGFVPHLDDACIGSVSEILDAEQPFTPSARRGDANAANRLMAPALRPYSPGGPTHGEGFGPHSTRNTRRYQSRTIRASA
jgi:glycogen debranching enzyme